MKIAKKDQYHGAALLQIAQDDTHTTINGFTFRGEKSHNAFGVNEVGVYFKYCAVPRGAYTEYVFNFSEQELDEIDKLHAKYSKAVVALICIKAGQVCCFPYQQLLDLRAEREKTKGRPEKTSTILVTIPDGKNFRVYMNYPGTKGKSLGVFKVPRRAFPKVIFDQ